MRVKGIVVLPLVLSILLCLPIGCSQNEKETECAHEMGEYTVVKEASCDENGYCEGVCVHCGRSLSETLIKTGHAESAWTVQTYATIDTDGKRTMTCTVCGEVCKEEIIPKGSSEGFETDGARLNDIGTFVGTDPVIPEGIEIVGKNAFLGCVSLISATLPNGVTVIEENAFAQCRALVGICLPATITTIEVGAFADCNDLSQIYYMGSKADWDAISKQDGWDACAGDYTIVFAKNQ